MVDRILGEDARYYVLKDPDEIPGGYEFRFKGMDITADAEAKMTVKLSMFDRAQPDVANRAAFFKVLLESSDGFTQEEIEQITTLQPAPQAPPEGGPSGGAEPMPNPNDMATGAAPVMPPPPTESLVEANSL
jgi:hypothetical protein